MWKKAIENYFDVLFHRLLGNRVKLRKFAVNRTRDLPNTNYEGTNSDVFWYVIGTRAVRMQFNSSFQSSPKDFPFRSFALQIECVPLISKLSIWCFPFHDLLLPLHFQVPFSSIESPLYTHKHKTTQHQWKDEERNQFKPQTTPCLRVIANPLIVQSVSGENCFKCFSFSHSGPSLFLWSSPVTSGVSISLHVDS